ncbi:MAG TPA: hypothetical protein PKG77_18925, partial [Phycisphaerae bacterium]|nr:hypothetical protein [Phycisphaerae bacterium]
MPAAELGAATTMTHHRRALHAPRPRRALLAAELRAATTHHGRALHTTSPRRALLAAELRTATTHHGRALHAPSPRRALLAAELRTATTHHGRALHTPSPRRALLAAELRAATTLTHPRRRALIGSGVCLGGAVLRSVAVALRRRTVRATIPVAVASHAVGAAGAAILRRAG